MNYTKKSFSVVMGGDAYRDNFDRIFRSKTDDAEQQPAPVSDSGAPGLPPAEPVSDSGTEELPDLSERQCASCLERNALVWIDRGLIQCAICLSRFPQGVEQNMKVPPEKACPACGGTGRLRTSFAVFGCSTCGGTGAKGA